jgi:hypothetical protein
MEQSAIISLLREAKEQIKKALKELSPEECSCHERDSSYVCNVCYKEGYRGHMQEDSSNQCDDCCLWSDSNTCDFCGKTI